jgi:hypothetical protein
MTSLAVAAIILALDLGAVYLDEVDTITNLSNLAKVRHWGSFCRQREFAQLADATYHLWNGTCETSVLQTQNC